MKKVIVTISLFIFITTALAVSPTLTSFNGGQVSPLMESRVDFPKYSSSLRTLENMLVTVQGPVERRPGTKYIASQRSSSAAGRLIGFERSADESYILLFEDQFLRFFTQGGQILAGVGTEDISSLDNVVAHWPMNTTTGTVILDDDGGDHNMDTVGSVDLSVLTAAPLVGAASYDFDGQYSASRADHADFSFTDNSDDSAFSISCWAFITNTDSEQVVLSKWKDTNSAREWKLILTDAEKLELRLADTTADLESDRTAQWYLNDDAATTAIDDAVASIPHDGVASANTDTLTATGQIGKAINFGGTASIVINDHDQLSFGDSSDDVDFSLTAWIYVTPHNAQQSIIAKWDSGSPREWILRLEPGEKLLLAMKDESVSATVWSTTDDALSTGWHFVVATYENDKSGTTDATAGERIVLYVDNVEVDVTASVSGGTYVAMENSAAKLVLGARKSAAPQNFFQDRIDNVVIYKSKLLSVSEIAILWNSGNGTETTTGVEVSAITDSAISIGWHHIGATYSAPADEATAADGIILYVDGAAVDSTATNDVAYTAMQNAGEEIRMAAQESSSGSAEQFYADKLDALSIYSDVLTPAEMAIFYTTTPFEIATPYLTADLFELNVTKNDDVMYIAHPDYKPKQLSSTGPSLWTLEDVDFQTGPFLPENDTSTTIASDGTTGTVTLTASKSIFKKAEGASHIGSIWQFNQVGGSPTITDTFTGNGISIATKSFVGGYSFTTTDSSWQGTITLQRSTNDGISWRPALEPLTDTNFDNPSETEEDGAMYRVVASNFVAGTLTYKLTVHDETNRGVVRITGVESGTSATAIVLNDLVSTSATVQWREGYWSDFRGWPKTVTVHQQRLVFGGSVSFPQTIWWGRQDPDEYENFLEGTLDTSAFTVELEGQNPVRWLLSQDYMLIGTSGTIGKWGDQGEAVTPRSPNYQEQTRHGSAAIQAGLGGDSVLYIERGSRKVRQFSFDLQVDKYLSPDLTILSPEITESGIVEIAFQLRPDPILWCVLGNGNMATLTYQRDQSIAAWTKQITDGDFTSVAVIPGQVGTNEDEVWVIAEREINSSTVFYVEQFQPQEWGSDPNDAWFVDSGITYSGVATDTFTGADHLEAETVSIYADRLIESPEVVANGGFTIDNAASRVLVGMAYTSKLETLPLVIDPQDRAANKKVRKVSFDVYKTGAFKYGNGASSTLTNVIFGNNLDLDNNATAQDLDVTPATSIEKPLSVAWNYGSMKKQTIYVESDEPMPLTIRAITTDYKFYGN